jgi:hypothetical protein
MDTSDLHVYDCASPTVSTTSNVEFKATAIVGFCVSTFSIPDGITDT